MKYMTRPLTTRMISKLQECRQMELEGRNGQPCPPEHFNSSLPGLYTRGLINVKKYSSQGKELIGVYLTQDGITFLEHFGKFQKIDRL